MRESGRDLLEWEILQELKEAEEEEGDKRESSKWTFSARFTYYYRSSCLYKNYWVFHYKKMEQY